MLISELAARLMVAKGFLAINRNPGLTWLQVDDDWMMAVNGHGEAHTAHSPHLMDAVVEAYCFAFWRKGWYIGQMRPYMHDVDTFAEGGFLVGGERADQELQDVLKRALRAARAAGN